LTSIEKNLGFDAETEPGKGLLAICTSDPRLQGITTNALFLELIYDREGR
jgi:hypothetical protein